MEDAKRKSQFGKMLLSYLLTVILPVVIISLIYYLHMAVEKKEELQKQAQSDLESLYGQTKMVKDNIDNLALQLAMTPDLNAKLTNPFSADMYDFNLLKDHLKSQISASPLIYSMYIYFKLNDKVLTTREGFYTRPEFFDKELLNRIVQRGEGQSDYEVRTLQSMMDPPVDVISFNRPLPVTSKDTLGQLVLNVRKDVFFGMIERLADMQLSGITILRGDTGQVIYGTGSAELLEALPPDTLTGSRIVVNRDGEHFITSMKSRFNSWVFVKSTPYSVYQEAMSGVQDAIVRTAAVVLAIGFAMSFMVSWLMYGPWKRMLREHEEIKRTVERNKPIVKHRLIYDMLNNYITEPNQIHDHLQQVGVQFPLEHYTVLLVSPHYKRAEGMDEEPNVLAFSFVENALLKLMPIAGTLLDHGQFGFILNGKHPEPEEDSRQELARQLHEINESLQQQHAVSLQFAVGRSGASLRGIHLSYAEVKRMMNYKALFNKSDVVFVQEMETDQRMEYPLAVQKELVHHIMATDHEKANDAVTEFMKAYVQKSTTSRKRLLEMILMLLSNIMNELYQQGYDASVSLNVLELNNCRNNEELESFIRRYAEELIGELEQQQQESSTYSLYIAKAIEFIETNYPNNISVTDIADHVGLSGSYLSRVFKAETGKPPLEYLSRHRIMRSKELLQQDVRSSMQEVSQSVGYHDAHSFIRFFKKYEGLTPGEYRKKLLEKKDPVQPEM